MSTLRDAHVSHNSIPGPQGVQSSGETAPVMGRSLITTRASPLIGFVPFQELLTYTRHTRAGRELDRGPRGVHSNLECSVSGCRKHHERGP